jgi:hypothetical protein
MLCRFITKAKFAECGEPICQVSFCATRNTSLTVGTDRVTFDNTTINDGNAFDLDTSRFTPPQAGLYWIHFSVGMQPNTDVDVRLQGASRTPDIVRPHTSYTSTPTTTSRVDFIQSDGSDGPMWLSSDSALYSDAFLQTSFSGFLLSSAMDPLVAFAVGLSTPIVNTPANTRIAYSTSYLDTHSGWDAVNNEYVVPVAGAYVITGQCGVYPGDRSGVRVYVNGVKQFIVHISNDNTHTGTDFVSKTVILQLIQGDRLYSQTTVTNTGYSLYGDIRHPTSLLGFLYSPYRSVPISWSVAREASGSITGPVEAYPFDTVYVNQGNGWQESNYRFVAPVGGVYYIQLTAGVYLNRARWSSLSKV